ncbi:integrase catalytic domain-containing protein [Pedobacter roseus]|uniref:Transposase family protein n=1 Tax=Pedobacter roseus TaxID=336820 RepID=A0A7G9QMA3_9SPHI|nr:DDE-type integrase/transposase/recombinase [Pedobacter roseus]QNN44478.1 transposase family protein [Pedobacter roseus]
MENKTRYDNLSYLYKAMEIFVGKKEAFKRVAELWTNTCPKKMISIEAYTNSVSIFEFLSGLKEITPKEKFYLYYNFLISSDLDELPSFVTYSFKSFNNKYCKYINSGAKIFFHENHGNTYAEKLLTSEDEKMIKELYQNGVRYSYRQISRFVNTARILRGDKAISIHKVIDTIKDGDGFSKLYFRRNGRESINAAIYHPGRASVSSPGAQYQLDGTRLNILYKDHNNEIGFLNLIVAIDIYSRRIVSHFMAKSENFLAYKTIIIDSVKNTGFLPAEILTDNLPALNSRPGITFFSKLKRLGVYCRRHSKLNPSDKGHVESWFGVFSSQFLKDVPGFLGDGITSKNKDGKPNSDLKEKYRNKANIMTRPDLEFLIESKIKEYNSSYLYNNAHPNELFWEGKASKSIPVPQYLYPYIAFVEKEKYIKKTGFRLQAKGFYFDYCFPNKDLAIFERYLETTIVIRYNPNKMDSVYLYKDEVTQNYMLELKVNEQLPMAYTDQTEDQKIKWRIFSKNRYDMKRELMQKSFSNCKKKSRKSSRALPLEALLYTKDSKEEIHNSEKKHILKGSKDKIVFKTMFRVKK